jgi:hypothetical protein
MLTPTMPQAKAIVQRVGLAGMFGPPLGQNIFTKSEA